VNRSDVVHGLEFDDQAPLHEQVGPAVADEALLVDDWNGGLPNEADATVRQLDVERVLVDALEKPGPRTR
jgi:hypothetical protein